MLVTSNGTAGQVVNMSQFPRIVEEHMTGVIINVSSGKESFGSFSIRGTLITSDGGMSTSEATDVINCSPGCRPWTLMRFALCRGEERIDGFDTEYLDMLGFVLGGKTNQSVPV